MLSSFIHAVAKGISSSTKEKSKQNITRDIEVKNNLTIARAEGVRGQWEEGITGTTIKDTWMKSRGRVEVGEGGGVQLGWGRGMGRKGTQL